MDHNTKVRLNKKIFVPVAVVLGILFAFGIFFRDAFCTFCTTLLDAVLLNFNWLILLVAVITGVLLIYMIIHPDFGKKIIGGPDAKPEYGIFTWIAMAICSSIGIAMMFYAVSEPLGYFFNPPAYLELEAGTNHAALAAVAQSTLHWSVLYYALQIFWGIIVVYLSMNKGLPFRPSTALYPLLKNKIFGWQGTLIDIISSITLICGTVTCFGLGTMQFSTGLSYVTGIEITNKLYVIIVVLVTLVFTFSSARGVKKGMAVISNVNTYIYIALILFLLFAGPTKNLLELIVGSIGETIRIFPSAMFNGDFLGTNDNFSNYNTAYYYIWTLAFSPIAGMFYAKIAKGRTIRQFIVINWMVPSAFILTWFSLWGGNAIWLDLENGGQIQAAIAEWGVPVANFALLNEMPLGGFRVILPVVAVLIGFITMTDALTGIVSSLTTKNSRAKEAPIPLKLFWGCLTGGLTLVCLFVLQQVGTSALQSLAVGAGFLILLITIAACYGSVKIVNGSVDHYLDDTEEGKAAIEISKKEETEA
ncbi:MAG: BCCT family transporter [Clostridiales bacterium]|nr:BCCT family transporter [Clostridiales bacterium]